MVDILNELSKEQILNYKKKTELTDRACAFCETVKPMKEGQKYCSAKCRAAAHTMLEQIKIDKLRAENELLRYQVTDLETEIAELRAQLEARP